MSRQCRLAARLALLYEQYGHVSLNLNFTILYFPCSYFLFIISDVTQLYATKEFHIRLTCIVINILSFGINRFTVLSQL